MAVANHLRFVQELIADSNSLRSGRDRLMPAPKEQPPRNLSGKRTTAQQNLESVHESNGASPLATRSADGITLSGNVTDGALEIVHHGFRSYPCRKYRRIS